MRIAVGGPFTEEFDAFAWRERTRLVTFAWTLTGSLAVAEELAQEALIAAWHGWDRVGTYDRPGAWARRVVANRAAGVHRRAGREHRAVGRLAGSGLADEPDVAIGVENAALWEAVRALSLRQAQVVSLHYLEDRSVGEIAAILGCAEGTVKAHLYRGRRELARRLGLLEDDG